MEQFEEHVLEESHDALGRALDQSTESPEFLESDQEVGEEAAFDPGQPIDDPVRVYLKEMGSVSLLTRQGEIDLARRLERGRLRTRKVISRSPIVQQIAGDLYENVREDRVKLASWWTSARPTKQRGSGNT